MIGFSLSDRPSSVLCVGAHPDDIEMGAAGLIGFLADKCPESRFHFAIATGDGLRAQEAADSATDLLGDRVEVSFGRMTDGYLPYSHAAEVKDFLREIRHTSEPDLIIAPHRHDRHQDHRIVAEMTHQLFRESLILEYEIIKLEGDLGHPGVFLPMTIEQAEAKLDHMDKHFGSQHSKIWYRRETIAGLMRIRGVECLAADGYAEAFHSNRLSIG